MLTGLSLQGAEQVRPSVTGAHREPVDLTPIKHRPPTQKLKGTNQICSWGEKDVSYKDTFYPENHKDSNNLSSWVTRSWVSQSRKRLLFDLNRTVPGSLSVDGEGVQCLPRPLQSRRIFSTRPPSSPLTPHRAIRTLRVRLPKPGQESDLGCLHGQTSVEIRAKGLFVTTTPRPSPLQSPGSSMFLGMGPTRPTPPLHRTVGVPGSQ